MEGRILHWGLLSTARINHALITPLKASKRNQLLAVASRDLKKADAYAERWGIERAHGSYAALLADPEIDVIYNPLPNHLHAEWTIKAAEAGKHVLCEKPLALTVAEVDAMATAAQENNVVVAEAFMYRHHPQTRKVKELLDGGEIGQLQLIRGSFAFPLDNPGDIRLEPAMGGGSLWDVGCYPVSYARYLAGTIPTDVSGWQATTPGGVDDTFVGQLRFPGDIFAQIHSGFNTPLRSQLEVIGSQGSIEVPVPFTPQMNEKILLKRGESVQVIEIPGQELYIGEVEDMWEAIQHGTAACVSLVDSRENVATLAALLESARRGQTVALGL